MLSRHRVLSLRLDSLSGNSQAVGVVFHGLHFATSPDALAPYPQTEALVDKALELLTIKKPRILDIGTGSGNIIISILKAIPGATGVGVDISHKALAVAHRNARTHGLLDQLELKFSDVFSEVRGKFNLIVCNPPYWTGEQADALGRAVPRIAFTDGGYVERMVKKDAARFLRPGGWVAMESALGLQAVD